MIKLPTPALIGVIHLPALPGSPANRLDMDQIAERALADAKTLAHAGFDAAIVENFGDAPFSSSELDPASVAAMAILGDRVRTSTGLTLGINALRNDAKAALGIAVACSATFIRVNVHTGVAATDQGIISGRADETLRYRKQIGHPVAILADVDVKHATSLSHASIGQAAADTAYRGLADGLIVTGPATGAAVDPEDLRRVREAVPDRRIFVGSGATVDSIGDLLSLAGGVIVGSGIKVDGDPSRPIDADLAKSFAMAAGRGG